MENEEQNLSNPAITSASQPDSTYEASPTPNVPENQPKRRSTRLIIFAVLGVLLLIGLVLGGGYYWYTNNKLNETPADTSNSKLDINVVCEQSLMYKSFPDGESAAQFVAECKEGKHPEVIEEYKERNNLGDGAAI